MPIEVAILSLLTMIMLITIHDFLTIYFDNRYQWKKSILTCLYIGYFVLGMCLYLFQVPPDVNLILNVIVLLIITAGYQSAFSNRLFISVSIVAVMVAVEILVTYVFGLFFNEPVEVLWKSGSIVLYMLTLARLFPFVVVKLYKIHVRKKGNIVEKENRMVVGEWIFMAMIPLCSIVLLTLLFKVPAVSDINLSIMIFIILILNIAFYYIYNRVLETTQLRTDMLLINQQMEYYNAQYEEIQNSLQENRAIKHDLKYHLIYLFSKLQDKPFDVSMENELNQMLDDTFHEKYTCYANYPALDMILNHMIHKANKRGIQTDVNVSIYDKLYIDGKILCVIIGNAMENAIEACQILESKYIHISIVQQNSNLYIDISNPYCGEIQFENGLPKTKKEDKQLHGLGLKSIKKLIENNGGYLQITTDNQVFCLKIILNNQL